MKRPTDKQDEHYWIERYLQNQMTADERVYIEREMQIDPTLKQEVDLLKRTYDLMHEAFLEQQAIATLKRLQAQTRVRIHRIRLLKRSFLGATALAAMFVLYVSFTPISFPDSENDISVTRSLSDDSTAIKQKQVFEQFFEGQTHLAEGQYALAVKNFEQVVNVTTIRPYFREAAQWHLAVAYLKSGQPDKAERIYDQFVHCIDCEYQINQINRWKFWWQIKWAQWT
ncbi:tetratricopeptide repeat protein [Spirosoma sp. HMF3257]|uniref:Tetratricopeptide repeat protein n=1 Tax=Spirosoma telluris TaxID=2183553 RepID=A0A327NN12_9BACT|nr:tetratricopeptide repeat protein [Spirosoma telluris]RAI76085.1 hypothetical protein HMF3257_21290 [Spirosoma telluris]